MELREFEKLTHEEKFRVTQDRLWELKKEGKGTKEFKNEQVDFSYTTAMNKLDNKYKLNQSDYCLIEKLSLSEIGGNDLRGIDNIELESLVTKIIENKLSDLRENQPKEKILNEDYTKNVIVQKRRSKELKKMTITISADVHERWRDFCEELGIYNNIDLLNTAITSYLDSVNFKSKID
ncbi:MAG: hypothetical protein Q4B63_11995 [Clostridium perfringens]|nr:hypothetical protein [Clostridium perfringens]